VAIAGPYASFITMDELVRSETMKHSDHMGERKQSRSSLNGKESTP
jgi:hypothetical protein